MQPNGHRIAGAAMALLLGATAAHAGDCFNDEVPPRTDLEPAMPGSSAELLSITDRDVERVLREIAEYEGKRQAAEKVATGVADPS